MAALSVTRPGQGSNREEREQRTYPAGDGGTDSEFELQNLESVPRSPPISEKHGYISIQGENVSYPLPEAG